MLIGICGLINSGKDTLANVLIEEYSFKKDSFASTLKDVLSVLFNWNRKLLEGDTEDSRNWRNQIESARRNFAILGRNLNSHIWDRCVYGERFACKSI